MAWYDSPRLSDWHDLEKYGIETLTGEACGIGTRLLCDLSPEGTAIIERMLGITVEPRNNSWNHQGQEGWHSMMIPRSLLKDLLIYVLAEQYPYVGMVDHRAAGAFMSFYVIGLPNDEARDEWKTHVQKIHMDKGANGENIYYWRLFTSGGTARNGTRNRHMFSGRVD